MEQKYTAIGLELDPNPNAGTDYPSSGSQRAILRLASTVSQRHNWSSKSISDDLLAQAAREADFEGPKIKS
jgi:hypothetical protein